MILGQVSYPDCLSFLLLLAPRLLIHIGVFLQVLWCPASSTISQFSEALTLHFFEVSIINDTIATSDDISLSRTILLF